MSTANIRKLKRKLDELGPPGRISTAINRIQVLHCLGEEFREIPGHEDETIHYFELSTHDAEVHKLDKEYAAIEHRCLAEIYSRRGDRAKTERNLELYLQVSKKHKFFDQIQLHHHVSGYCLLQLATHEKTPFAERKEMLLKAVDCMQSSLTYLQNNRRLIEKCPDFKLGGSIEVRKANALRQLACIEMHIPGRERDVERHMEMAIKTSMLISDETKALEKAKHGQLFACYADKAKIPWLEEERESCVKKMIEYSSTEAQKTEAKMQLGLMYFDKNDFGRSRDSFVKLYADKENRWDKMSEDDQSEVLEKIKWMYKRSVRQRNVERAEQSSSSSKKERRIAYEKLADTYFEMEKYENALENYRKCLNNCEKDEDRDWVLGSCGAAADDCKKYAESMNFHTERLALRKSMQMSERRILDVEIDMLDTQMLGYLLDEKSILKRVNELLPRIHDKQKIRLLESTINFLNSNGVDIDVEERCNYSDLLEELKAVDDDSPFEQPPPSETTDEVDEMLEEELLLKVNEMADNWKWRLQLKNELKKTINLQGETRLHELVKEGDLEKVKAAVEMGYDMNRRDHGGWTPFAEAVSYEQYDIVEFLLRTGQAKVDMQSTASVEDEEKGTETGSGITPLMDACWKGALRIVELLLRARADVTLKNENGLTAADFLLFWIQAEDDPEDADVKLAKKIFKRIQDAQRAVNFPVRIGPPPPLRKKTRSPAAPVSGGIRKRRLNERRPRATATETYRSAIVNLRPPRRLSDPEPQLEDPVDEDQDEENAPNNGVRFVQPKVVDDVLLSDDVLGPSASTRRSSRLSGAARSRVRRTRSPSLSPVASQSPPRRRAPVNRSSVLSESDDEGMELSTTQRKRHRAVIESSDSDDSDIAAARSRSPSGSRSSSTSDVLLVDIRAPTPSLAPSARTPLTRQSAQGQGRRPAASGASPPTPQPQRILRDLNDTRSGPLSSTQFSPAAGLNFSKYLTEQNDMSTRTEQFYNSGPTAPLTPLAVTGTVTSTQATTSSSAKLRAIFSDEEEDDDENGESNMTYASLSSFNASTPLPMSRHSSAMSFSSATATRVNDSVSRPLPDSSTSPAVAMSTQTPEPEPVAEPCDPIFVTVRFEDRIGTKMMLPKKQLVEKTETVSALSKRFVNEIAGKEYSWILNGNKLITEDVSLGTLIGDDPDAVLILVCRISTGNLVDDYGKLTDASSRGDIVQALSTFETDGALDLSQCILGDNDLDVIARVITAYERSVTMLDLSSTSSRIVNFLTTLSPQLSTLTTLNLSSSTVDRESLAILTQNCSFSKTLTSLNLSSTQLDSGEYLASLLEKCGALVSLEVNAVWCTNDTMLITEALCGLHSLETLKASQSEWFDSSSLTQVVRECKSLKILDASATGVTAVDLEVGSGAGLQKLILMNCRLDETTFEAFSKWISSCLTLTHLDLRGCQGISSDVVEDLTSDTKAKLTVKYLRNNGTNAIIHLNADDE